MFGTSMCDSIWYNNDNNNNNNDDTTITRHFVGGACQVAMVTKQILSWLE